MTAGDIATLIVGGAAAIVAIIAVWVAVRANGIAGEANRRAKEANDEAAKANEIATEALDVQKSSLPPAWSAGIWNGKNKLSFENQSGRHIIVTGIDPVPADAGGLLQPSTEPPTRIEYGDMYELHVFRAMEGAEAVQLRWHFEDETDSQITERRL